MSFTLAPLSVPLMPTPTIRRCQIPATKGHCSFFGPLQVHSHIRLSAFTRCYSAPHAILKGRDMSLEKEKTGGGKMLLLGLGLGLGAWMMSGATEAAWAFGPEGPLVEEFWENMRRYGLYFFTVGTGALYTILKPIYDLLKSPVSAVLVILIVSSSFYLLYLVLSAMIGLSDFSYQYAS